MKKYYLMLEEGSVQVLATVTASGSVALAPVTAAAPTPVTVTAPAKRASKVATKRTRRQQPPVPAVMKNVRSPPPFLAKPTNGCEDGSSSSVARDDADIKFQPAVKMEAEDAEFISPEAGTVSAPQECPESDPLDLTCSEVKCKEEDDPPSTLPSPDVTGLVEHRRGKQQRVGPAVGGGGGGEDGSSSSVVQDDADIRCLPPPVKMEAEEAESTLPDIGPEQCIERDPLELTTSEVKCKEEDGEESAPPLSPEPAATDPIETLESVRSTAKRQTTQNGDGETLRCPHCDYSCLGQDRLDKHVKNRHGCIGRNGRHKCELCAYSTDNVTDLTRHRTFTHQDERSREDMEQEIAELNATQKHILRLRQAAGKPKPAKSDKATSTADDETAVMLSFAREIDTLVLASGHQLHVFPLFNVIVCRTCAPDFDPTTSKTPRSPMLGLFRYDMNVGTGFLRSTRLPTKFVSLKNSVNTHLKSRGHLENYKKRKAQREKIEKRRTAAASKTILVLRNAYQALGAPWSREAYEDITSLRHLK